MKITKKVGSINRDRKDGTNMSYYIFDEYEVNYDKLAPKVVQPWHHHETISETLYIVEGNKLHYLDGGNKKRKGNNPWRCGLS